jgi:hypothetical protein
VVEVGEPGADPGLQPGGLGIAGGGGVGVGGRELRGQLGGALSRAAMAGQPSLSTVRQAYICAVTRARAGSRVSRDSVRPWAALNGTGCGMRWAAYP